MKRITFLITIIVFAFTNIYAQTEKDPFKPSGKVFVRVFTNFHSSFSEGSNASAFELERAYFGYDFNLSENFSGKINFDIGNPEVGKLEMVAYIKNAYLSYTKDKFSVYFGMISTTSFKQQEELWGYRYIEKSFQDAYKMGSSADLGISASYNFSNWLSADVILINGEGYKNIQADNNYKAGLGATITPVKNLIVRGYYDILGFENIQSTLATFVCYNFGKASLGAEYDLQQNNGNIIGKDYSGYSFYATVNPFKKIKFFGRYDYVASNTLAGESSNWNTSKDGSLVYAGFEYQPVKGIKIAPNYRYWNPSDNQKSPVQYFYLSCEIKF